jgi:hypothetical protein
MYNCLSGETRKEDYYYYYYYYLVGSTVRFGTFASSYFLVP